MFRFIFNYIKQHKGRYLMTLLALIIYDVTLIMPTQIIQRLIDAIASNGLTLPYLSQEIIFLLSIALLNYATAVIWSLYLFQSSVNFKFSMQQGAFRKMVKMRTSFYAKFRSGDMLTRFSTDVEGMMELMGYGLMIIVYGGGMLVFTIPIMVLIDWQIALAALVPLFILTVTNFLISRKQKKIIEENREAVASLSTEVLEVVEGIRVTRAYSKKAHQTSLFQKKTAVLTQKGNQIQAISALYTVSTNIFMALSNMLILFLGIGAVRDGRVSLGQILALQLYVTFLMEPFSMLGEFLLVYQTGKMSFGKLQELIETDDDLEVDGQKELDKIEDISFENYHFSYPSSEQPVLSQINWTIKAGQTVGIVGKTGAGKTSLVRQFLRQYPLGQGDFSINRIPVKEIVRSSIEKNIAYVPQEHILFSKSVYENIAFGKKDATVEQVLAAIETAAFTQDLERMQDGLDTLIGERGVSISGGQKQRIALARAFLRQSDLLILDDSLSAVDARTEREIIQHIQKERAGKTNIIVTHRLSAVAHADWVIVLEDGKIVEEGTPDSLLAQRGWYYEQYQRQQSQEEEV